MQTQTRRRVDPYLFLPKNAELSGFIRRYDWSQTPLGPINSWPQSLKTSVNIILSSPIPSVLLWGPDGILIYNDGYAKFSAGRHPELLGVRAVDSWEEVRELNETVIRECFHKGKPLSYENIPMQLNRNGTPEDFRLTLQYSPIDDEDGKRAGVMAVVIDTTAQMRAENDQSIAEAETKAERHKLQLMFEKAPSLIALLHGPKHVFTFANKTYLEVTGKQDIIGKALVDALPEIRNTELPHILDDVLKTGNPFIGNELEVPLDRKGTGKPEICYFNFVYQPLSNVQGVNTDIYVHAVDVTEQVRSRQELAETNRMYDALFNSSAMAIARADLHGNVLEVNKAFTKLFGYSHADVKRGLTSRMLTPDDQVTVTEHIYDALCKYGATDTVEKHYLRKDGTTFPGLVGAIMLQGRQEEFLSFILDISEQERLKALSKAKDEFVALASHQLRTPASSVKQYLGLLLEGYMGDIVAEQRDILDKAYQSNERQLRIIDDLLRTAQIDSSVYKMTFEKKELISLTRTVMAQYQPMLDERSQQYSFASNKKSISIPLDETEMAVCIANLIENASKYSPHNTTVAVSIKATQKAVLISVQDKGVGIDPDNHDRVFEKFTRVDNELSDTVSGNGLGLYWVKRIVELHGGTIRVKSALGKGTTFTITLPC